MTPKPRPIPTIKGSFIFEWLNAHNVSWRVYHCGISFFALFDRFEEVLGPNFRSFRHFPGDLEAEPVSEMPQVIFIEPEYTDSPVHLGWTPNDNHPPTAVGRWRTFSAGYLSATDQRPCEMESHAAYGYRMMSMAGSSIMFRRLAISTPVPPGSLFSVPFESTGPRVPSSHRIPMDSAGHGFQGYNGSYVHTAIAVREVCGNARL